jgi:hypothetical protein
MQHHARAPVALAAAYALALQAVLLVLGGPVSAQEGRTGVLARAARARRRLRKLTLDGGQTIAASSSL